MPFNRIWLPIAIAALLAVRIAAADDNRADLVRRIDASLEKATRYLIAAQSPDGAWRSETYGALRDGPSLTPFVISGLWFLPQAGPQGKTAFRKGADYLVGFVDDKGQLRVGPRELLFPVYTAAWVHTSFCASWQGDKKVNGEFGDSLVNWAWWRVVENGFSWREKSDGWQGSDLPAKFLVGGSGF